MSRLTEAIYHEMIDLLIKEKDCCPVDYPGITQSTLDTIGCDFCTVALDCTKDMNECVYNYFKNKAVKNLAQRRKENNHV